MINRLLCLFLGHKKMEWSKLLNNPIMQFKTHLKDNTFEVFDFESCERCHSLYYEKYYKIEFPNETIISKELPEENNNG